MWKGVTVVVKVFPGKLTTKKSLFLLSLPLSSFQEDQHTQTHSHTHGHTHGHTHSHTHTRTQPHTPRQRPHSFCVLTAADLALGSPKVKIWYITQWLIDFSTAGERPGRSSVGERAESREQHTLFHTSSLTGFTVEYRPAAWKGGIPKQ